MAALLTLSVLAVLASIIAFFSIERARTSRLPPSHLLNHPVILDENALSPREAADLMALMQRLGEFRTHAADLTFYKTTHEHIGEAQPLSPQGTCTHPFLIPNTDRTACVLPGRLDVARAYALAGGYEGLKETLPLLLSRVQSFGRYHFNISEHAEVEYLFNKPQFQALARAVCPTHQQLLDPFQFNFIVNLPGQTVASHIDAPYFFGADRFHVPQWLLAVMVFSGLFQREFVHQVQVVAYVHRWQDPTGATGGEFVYWDDASGVSKHVRPLPLSGSSVDGSKVVHAATVFRPDVRPPMLDKSKTNVLRFVQNSDDSQTQWQLTSNNEMLQRYRTDELRFSVVYRARCFADDSERRRFAHQRRGEGADSDMMPLETILGKLKDELVRRGRAASRAQLDAMPILELSLFLVDEYARYPLSETAKIPFNYCALKHSVLARDPKTQQITDSQSDGDWVQKAKRLARELGLNVAHGILDLVCDQ